MIKTITLEWLQSQNACKESIEEWHGETDHDTFATLNRLVNKNRCTTDGRARMGRARFLDVSLV